MPDPGLNCAEKFLDMFFLVATIISVLVLCSTTDVRDKDNRTPLHWACEEGSKDVVQYLVEERKMDVGEIIGERDWKRTSKTSTYVQRVWLNSKTIHRENNFLWLLIYT